MYRRGQEAVLEKSPVRVAAPRAPRQMRRLRDVHDRRVFEAVLHHERARANRDTSEFSLVLFKVRWGQRRSAVRLARSILARARTTDEVGWFGPECLCVLLPSTSQHGARCFEASVRRLADARGVAVVSRAWTYPSQWFTDNEAHGAPGPRLHREVPESALKDTPALPRTISQQQLLPFVMAGLVESLEKDAIGLEALHTLMVCPMPRWKRMIDVAVAGGTLLVLAPLMAVLALLVRLTSPGPVFFGQWRAGLGGRPFWIYKFRTMVPGADALKDALRAQSEQDGPAFKMECDPRITPIGRVLRKTSLDELPQLWNVLRGDMTLVGPRPLPLDEAAGCDQWQQQRLELTPGVTCIWQVKGRSRVTFVEWMRMDLAYARRRSLWQDIKILFQTVPAVLLRRGAR